jgi:fatty-acid peroxygenase
MSQIPSHTRLDYSFALLHEGYTFISKRCERYGSDVFETRLMLKKVICMMGAEAAQVFYEPGRFTRQGALPKSTLTLLQDNGSAFVIDGEAHHRRKQMFMSLMTPPALQGVVDIFTEEWNRAVSRWKEMDRLVLLEEVQEILCRTICAWSGVPLKESEVQDRTGELAAMIDGAGSFGLRNWHAQRLRDRSERWIQEIIQDVRTHKLEVREGTPAHTIAWHRDLHGELLSTSVAAVEMLNLLRPTVAVANYVVFAAMALRGYPEYRRRLMSGDHEYLVWFVQEVRRFYPVFPLVGGCVLQEFDWRGHPFPKGTWVLLDLYGTNHDPRIWDEPHAFRPERFRDWNENAFELIPQGGGDYATNHRCAGEWLTIELLKQAVRLLTTSIRYDVPMQDLRYSLSRMPALPKSHFVISNVRQRSEKEKPSGNP